jgi:hypothetical protein
MRITFIDLAKLGAVIIIAIALITGNMNWWIAIALLLSMSELKYRF